MTVNDYIFIYKTSFIEKKILKYRPKLCRVVDPCKKVPDLICGVQDLLLKVVDLNQTRCAGSEIRWDPPPQLNPCFRTFPFIR